MKKVILIVLLVLVLIVSVFMSACSAIDPNIDSQIKDLVKNIPYPEGYNYVYDTGEKIQFGDISVDYWFNFSKHNPPYLNIYPNIEPMRIWDETTGEELTLYYIILHTKNDGSFILVGGEFFTTEIINNKEFIWERTSPGRVKMGHEILRQWQKYQYYNFSYTSLLNCHNNGDLHWVRYER